MTQPRSPHTSKTGRAPAASRPSAPAKAAGAGRPPAKPSAKRAPAKSATKRAATKRAPNRATAKRAPSKATATRARSAARRRAASSRPDELLLAAFAAIRDNLTRGVVLSGERLQEAIDDSVRRGRMTRDDAEDLAQSLIEIGRKQTQELLDDLEAVLSRSGEGVAVAAREASRRAIANVEATATRARRLPVADRALREVDRARRATRLATFPIGGYDSLSVGQVTARLADLTAPHLRKVRDYERRHANRKSVLAAIERQLSRD